MVVFEVLPHHHCYSLSLHRRCRQKLDSEIKSTKYMIKISRAELRRQMEEMGSALKGVDDSSDEGHSD